MSTRSASPWRRPSSRYLAAQKTEIDGAGPAALRRRLGDLRPRQRRRHGRGAARRARTTADLPRPQRAGDGARGDRLRQGLAPPPHDGLHHLDRPRRDQHGHGRGGRACQPPAGAAPARRRLRQSPARPGAAADRGFRRRNGFGQRLLPPGLALFRPHRAARADHAGAAARHGGPDRSRRMRPGDAGALPGHAGRGLRLSGELLRRAGLDAAPHPPGRGRAGGGGRAAQERRRGRFIVAGGGVLYSEAERALAAFATRHGIPVARDAGRQVEPRRTTIRSISAPIGVTGTGAANALAEEADVVLAVGTRLQDFTTGSWALFKNAGRRIIGLNVQAFDAGKHARAAAGRRCARRPRANSPQALGGWKAPRGLDERAHGAKQARWSEAAARYTAPTNAELPSDAQVIGAVQRAVAPVRHRRLRRGRPAGRTAQAVARRRSRSATTSNTAIPAWATRSPAGSA